MLSERYEGHKAICIVWVKDLRPPHSAAEAANGAAHCWPAHHVVPITGSVDETTASATDSQDIQVARSSWPQAMLERARTREADSQCNRVRTEPKALRTLDRLKVWSQPMKSCDGVAPILGLSACRRGAGSHPEEGS